LTPEARRALAEKVLARLDAAEVYAGKRVSLRSIMQAQARRLAAFVRGDEPDYVAFVGGW
jgi:CRISPR-associated protein Cas1